MKKVLAGALIALASVLIVRSCEATQETESLLQEQSILLQQQVNKVAKLVVTEGHFSEVYTYKDSKELFGSFLTADKKALVVVNAEVAILYDLKELEYELDVASKTMRITNLPAPEIKIQPTFNYYDVSADYLNPFLAEDYNTITTNVTDELKKKVEASKLISNAQSRLLTELSQLFVLTQSMGWTLVLEEKPIQDSQELQQFLD